MENYFEIVKTAVKAIDSKRGSDIEVIKVDDLTILTDYFVIASASSNTQLKAIADEVEYKLSEQGIEPHHIDENLTAINQLLKKGLPYYFYEVKGIHPYRTTYFTATKLRLLRDALAAAMLVVK